MTIKRFRTPVLALVFAFLTAQGLFAQIQTAQVTGGTLEGVVKDGIASFKGIPFAAPPVGDLRWKAPQPVIPWSGVRKADAFGKQPIQNPGLAMLMGSAGHLSEDCLYLNVWTPAKSPDERLPIMVWIYGGAFISGVTDTPLYDGTNLAKKGVVIVSVAYRLGPFGFLAHPELSRESGKGSGCYGIQDQVAGLRWVRDNIAQFGGDPSCVTIFGESAGGISVSMLTAVPAAKGLFQRAIAESGGSMTPAKRDHELGLNMPSLKLAEETGKRYLAKLGANNIQAARTLSAEQIEQGGMAMGMFWPVADGYTLPGDQYELFQAGRFNDTPILVGTNSDEGAMFVHLGVSPAAFDTKIRSDFGPAAGAVLKAYPHATDHQAFVSSRDAFRDVIFGWNTWTWAKLQTRKGKNKAFVYYFDHLNRTPTESNGSTHASELSYVFGNPVPFLSFSAPKPVDKTLGELMRSYWVNFARTGDPNGPGLPEWPAFNETQMSTMYFDKAPGARPLPNLEQLKAMDTYFAWRRAQATAGEPAPTVSKELPGTAR